MDVLSVGAVAIGPLLILGVILYTYVQANLENLRENWVQYRCNPLYMPFAGGVQPEVTTLENFEYCTNMMAQSVFGLLMEPVHLMFSVFTGVLGMINHDLGFFRNFVSGIMTFIMSFAAETFAKIHNTFGEVITIMARIRDLTSRILGSAGYASTIAITVVHFIESLWGMLVSLLKTIVIILFAIAIILVFVAPELLAFIIPIGVSLGISYCFHPDTPIHVTGRGLIPVSNVKVGDELRPGCTVTAVMWCLSADITLYTYEGVVVSGNHLVREDGRWIYVEQSARSIPYIGDRPKSLFCFNTTTHQIPIGGTVFADYEEIEEPPSYDALEPTDTVFTPMGRVKLADLKPGTQTLDGMIEVVVYLPNGKMQVFIRNTDGYFYVNGNRRVRDYPDSHDASELHKIQERVLLELNKNVLAL